jgi:hypothetical protein
MLDKASRAHPGLEPASIHVGAPMASVRVDAVDREELIGLLVEALMRDAAFR